MRFWCSVSDRCSGKIEEGKVPPACSSCVYTLCLEQRGLVISAMIDAVAGEQLEHIYMKHRWEDHEQAAACCHYLSCTLPGPALAKQARCNTTDHLQQFLVWRSQLTFLGMIHRVARASWTLLPMYTSLSCVICKQPLSSASGELALLKTSQWDVSPSCLCHPCTIINC